ncbi:DUF4192 domain-containing protein [Streptomyces sp. TRM72054]|uniref:DUF4192 domain-containing protein n=1 Tax=Streptomyces sp. TRM72054 TaxID=2870562 RepID=UPI0021AB4172|nr:DUF4192 domain-containing protein [Streptomyces sp. TRM72054]
MTNHGETTGSFGNGNGNGNGNDDVTGSGGAHLPNGPGHYDEGLAPDGRALRDGNAHNAHNADSINCDGPAATHRVTLRTPAELADALPYLLGYRPEDSIVLVALHDRGGRGRFGGRARLGIPANPDDWESVAGQLAHGLVWGSERRGARPEQIVAYVCQEPGQGETGRQVMARLRPLAHHLRLQCGLLDVPVIEALCISDGRFWSYCCDNQECCPAEGLPMGLPGTSVLAAAATYAGIQVRGTLRELRARLRPWETSAALEQEAALDAGSMALVPRMLDDTGRAGVAEETVELARRVMSRLADAPPASGAFMADLRDDGLLHDDEAATLILGLQDRTTRDRAAEWMEGAEAALALRLWRALARRCVGSYGEHAAAPLTLAGWVAWSTGDELEAREALAMALGADPDYLFARLLHQAVNEGLDPESIRRCLRAERDGRARTPAERPDEARGPEGLDTTQGTEGDGVDADGSESVAGVQRPYRGLPASDDDNSHSLTAQEARKSAPPSRRVPGAGTGPGAGRSGGTRPPAAAKGGVRRRGTSRRGVVPGGGETMGDV